jgi:murein DD-endopeptidase MepM/ murein hydrolase activator NlpD
MSKKGFLLAIVLLAILVFPIMVSAVTYLPSPSRPVAPTGKPTLILPYTDPAVRQVSGFGTSTHNDIYFTTHTHYGVDYATSSWGQFTVIASAGGRLIHATWTGSLPRNTPVEERTPGCDEDIDPITPGSQARVAIIDHGNGWRSIYLHLASYSVGNGVEVRQGDPIGTAGCSGSYWPHLHFELRNYSDTNGVWSYNPDFTTAPIATGPSLDIAFLIDTTGSMWDDIDRVKTDATQIVNRIKDANSNSRIAVLDFRDFPSRTIYYDYPYRDALPFTYSRDAAIQAIQSLSLGWGGDTPETHNCAIMHAIGNSRCAGQGADTTLGPWASSTKRIILMTDATALNPEPFTGFTTSQVIARALTGGFTFELFGGPEDEYGGIPPDPEGVAIYSVIIGGDASALAYGQELADATGGKVFAAATADDVVETLLEALDDVIEPPEPAPTCESAFPTPMSLWPVTNKLMLVALAGVENADTITITSVFQDEPVGKDIDAQNLNGSTVSLRAQRDGSGDGRVYHVFFTATGPGGTCSSVVKVIVPHDMGVGQDARGTVVDGGPIYNSTMP